MAMPNPRAPVQASQARLILQDPVVFDQASQPALRSSQELFSIDATSTLEREQARELWESMSMEPEVARDRQSERKRLLSRADGLTRESEAAKAEATALKAQLAREQEDRWNHPLIYAGAASLIGLGVLWITERRQRISLQEQQLIEFAEQSPTSLEDQSYLSDADPKLAAINAIYALEESQDLVEDFSTDVPGRTAGQFEMPPVESTHKQGIASDGLLVGERSGSPIVSEPPAWAKSKQLHKPPTEDEHIVVSQLQRDQSLAGRSKRLLSSLFRRSSPADGEQFSHSPTELPTTQAWASDVLSTQSHRFDLSEVSDSDLENEANEIFEQELRRQDLQEGDHPKTDLLPKIRALPQQGEATMAYLLELRTTMHGLCALGRHEGAARLLREHLDANPTTSAWAYVEYMHLCELLAQRDDFEAIRKRYRVEFNRMAPYWHEPNSYVLGIDGYARASIELCTVWAKGKEATSLAITSWLVGPILGRKIVQLPAYHDLFDLYEMLGFVDLPSTRTLATFESAIKPVSVAPTLIARHSVNHSVVVATGDLPTSKAQADLIQDDFVATVSLLELDYEFSSDVTLEKHDLEQSEKAVTIVKTGHFSVDFNVDGTEMGNLLEAAAQPDQK